MPETYSSNLLQNSSKWARWLGFVSIFILTIVDGIQPQHNFGSATAILVYFPLLYIFATFFTAFLAWLIPLMIKLTFNVGLIIKNKIFKNAKISDPQVLYVSAILISICLVELWLKIFWTPNSIPQRTIVWTATLALIPIFSAFMGQLESREDKINTISKKHTSILFKETIEISLFLWGTAAVFILIFFAVTSVGESRYLLLNLLSVFLSAIFIGIQPLVFTQLLFHLISNISQIVYCKTYWNKKISNMSLLYLSAVLVSIALFCIFAWSVGFRAAIDKKIIYGIYILIPLISVMIVHIKNINTAK